MVSDGPSSGLQNSFMQTTGYWIPRDWRAPWWIWTYWRASLTGWASAPTPIIWWLWYDIPVECTVDTCKWPTGGGWWGWYHPSRRGRGSGSGAWNAQRTWHQGCWRHTARSRMGQAWDIGGKTPCTPPPLDSAGYPFQRKWGWWYSQWRYAGGRLRRAPTSGFTPYTVTCGTW